MSYDQTLYATHFQQSNAVSVFLRTLVFSFLPRFTSFYFPPAATPLRSNLLSTLPAPAAIPRLPIPVSKIVSYTPFAPVSGIDKSSTDGPRKLSGGRGAFFSAGNKLKQCEERTRATQRLGNRFRIQFGAQQQKQTPDLGETNGL